MFDWVTIGTCSNCGGPVKTPKTWMSVMEPPVKCANCGAEKSHGPVIPMGPPNEKKVEYTTTGINDWKKEWE